MASVLALMSDESPKDLMIEPVALLGKSQVSILARNIDDAKSLYLCRKRSGHCSIGIESLGIRESVGENRQSRGFRSGIGFNVPTAHLLCLNSTMFTTRPVL